MWQDTIYTTVNAMLIAINPCKPIDGMYGHDRAQNYLGVYIDPAPHVYRTAARVFHGVQQGRCQSIVISGESGSGKTENFKHVIEFISEASARGRHAKAAKASLEVALLETSELLESFGNAYTTRNPNSSRFGKWVQLHFLEHNELLGVSVKVYLLEKTRAVHVGVGERGFHVFYELLRGGEPDLMRECCLNPPPTSRYLPPHSFELPSRRDDAAKFGELRTMLAAADIGRYDADQVFRTLAACLHLGALDFESEALIEGGEGAGGAETLEPTQGSVRSLQQAAELLGVEPKALSFVLCYRQIRTGREWVDSPNGRERALELCDSLTKAIYTRVFDWLVEQLNRWMTAGVSGEADADAASFKSLYERAPLFVGVLDIFGFEIFESNSLEQLLINYANEKLQGLFNRMVVLEEERRYADDGMPPLTLDLRNIDNAACRQLLEASGAEAPGVPKGLLVLLEEECHLPKGSDSKMLEKIFDSAGHSHPCLRRPPKPALGFAIEHYAGEVVYDADRFLQKNKDRCPEDVLVLLRKSELPYVQTLFTPTAQGQAQRSRKGAMQGTVAKFCAALDDLAVHLSNSDVCFIRCLKPNDQLKPEEWDQPKIMRQLRSNAVLPAVRLAAGGYPDHLLFSEVVRIFHSAAFKDHRERVKMKREVEEHHTANQEELVHQLLDPESNKAAAKDPAVARQACVDLMTALGVPDDKWAMGRTMLFLRSGMRAELEAIQREAHQKAGATLEAAARGFRARQHRRHMAHEAEVAAHAKKREAEHAKRSPALKKLMRSMATVAQLSRTTSALKLDDSSPVPLPFSVARAAALLAGAPEPQPPPEDAPASGNGGHVGPTPELLKQILGLQRRLDSYVPPLPEARLPAPVLAAAFASGRLARGDGMPLSTEEEATKELRGLQSAIERHRDMSAASRLPPAVFSAVLRLPATLGLGSQAGALPEARGLPPPVCTDKGLLAGLEDMQHKIDGYRELPMASRLPAPAMAHIFASRTIVFEADLDAGCDVLGRRLEAHRALPAAARFPPAVFACAFSTVVHKVGRPVATEDEASEELLHLATQLATYEQLPLDTRLPGPIWAAAAKICFEREGRGFVSEAEALRIIRGEMRKPGVNQSAHLRQAAERVFSTEGETQVKAGRMRESAKGSHMSPTMIVLSQAMDHYMNPTGSDELGKTEAHMLSAAHHHEAAERANLAEAGADGKFSLSHADGLLQHGEKAISESKHANDPSHPAHPEHPNHDRYMDHLQLLVHAGTPGTSTAQEVSVVLDAHGRIVHESAIHSLRLPPMMLAAACLQFEQDNGRLIASEAELISSLAAMRTAIEAYVALPTASKLPSPVLAAVYSRAEGWAGRLATTDDEVSDSLAVLEKQLQEYVKLPASLRLPASVLGVAFAAGQQRYLSPLATDNAVFAELNHLKEKIKAYGALPAPLRLPAPVLSTAYAAAERANGGPVTSEDQAWAELDALHRRVDAYLALAEGARLPAALLAASFAEFESYGGRPPATEGEALALLHKQLRNAQQAPERARAGLELKLEEPAWYVSKQGTVHEVIVTAQASASLASSAGQRYFTVVDAHVWREFHLGSTEAADGAIAAPAPAGASVPPGAFRVEGGRLFREPPPSKTVERLRQLGEREAEMVVKSEAELEEDRAQRARRRREEEAAEAQAKMTLEWKLWHPECRPAEARAPGIRGISVGSSATVPPPAEASVQDALVAEYASYLGMVLPQDAEFLPIARRGLEATSSLPDGWEMLRDPDGDVYFVDARDDADSGVAARQHPLDATYRHEFLAAKYGGKENGEYLTRLLERVKSKHIVDEVTNATDKELQSSAVVFGRLDPEREGLITLANFVDAMNKLDEKQGRARHTDTRLLAMFHAGDLAETGRVDFNEFIHMQHKKKRQLLERKERKAARAKAAAATGSGGMAVARAKRGTASDGGVGGDAEAVASTPTRTAPAVTTGAKEPLRNKEQKKKLDSDKVRV